MSKKQAHHKMQDCLSFLPILPSRTHLCSMLVLPSQSSWTFLGTESDHWYPLVLISLHKGSLSPILYFSQHSHCLHCSLPFSACQGQVCIGGVSCWTCLLCGTAKGQTGLKQGQDRVFSECAWVHLDLPLVPKGKEEYDEKDPEMGTNGQDSWGILPQSIAGQCPLVFLSRDMPLLDYEIQGNSFLDFLGHVGTMHDICPI